MPPRSRARIDRPPPKNLVERIRREIEEQGTKAVLVPLLAVVLLVMWLRLLPGPKDSVAAPRTGAARGSSASASPPAAAPAQASSPFGTAGAQRVQDPLPATAGPAPATVADADEVTRRIVSLAARLAVRPPPPPADGLRDPFDRSALDLAEKAAREAMDERDWMAALAAKDAASAVASFAGRLNATVPEYGIAEIDGRACRIGERAGVYELIEVGPGHAVLRDGTGKTLRLIVWREMQDLGRYVGEPKPRDGGGKR